MKLTIIYDNEVYKKDTGLKSDWGFSCLIETKDETILFDTGAKGKILLNNMKILGIDPGIINKIVISHEHSDHNGGLKVLGSVVGAVELYRLGKKQPSENMNLTTVEKPQGIAKGIYTTGKLKGTPVDEQSLVLKGKKGWFVLAGCSHNDVKNVLEKVEKYGEIRGIIGGLHGFKDFSALKDMDLICPTHCTKHIEEIKKLFSDAYISGGVGRKIEI